ncbi:unnamed protein product [Microthlaspi erraticum]|uniref:Integrase catalytic domain-containing protein n=1 Tax=Microthlaspi erraticum TaxID=1685480 RepID=A0A6D2KU37_9BRAS|nr:unnamed protein product [Microthlaspi erraticum]CAA7052630.1 unnamed protein product [Microthlaspi erraticum]
MWLKGVLYAPDLKCSLISVAKLLKAIKGSSITFTADLCVLQDHTKKTLIGAGEECGGVHVFRGALGGRAHKAAATSSISKDVWHRRLGHPSDRVLSHLPYSICTVKSAENDAVCDVCFRAKQTRDSFHESDNKAAGIFDLIHCDVWGGYRTPSSSGAVYFLTIVDDYSRAVWVFLLVEKREVALTLQNFFAMVERQFEKQVKMVRSDNGTEFTCMKSYFAKEGIIHQTSCVGTPQQNGRVERKHRHILNVARALMFQAKVPIKFWGECVLSACHLINRTPTPLLGGKTPYELLFGAPPDLDSLRVFGCLCYAHKQLRDKDKFAERSRKCAFMGYPYGKKGWYLYDLDTGEFFVSRDVVFHEDVFPLAMVETPQSQQIFDVPSPFVDNDEIVPISDRGSLPSPPEEENAINESPIRDVVENPQPGVELEVELGRGLREKVKSTKLRDFVLYTAQCSNDPPTSLLNTFRFFFRYGSISYCKLCRM